MSKKPDKKKMSSKKGYTIGITIFVDGHGRLSFFENGLRQNVMFLYHMFLAAPDCEKVYLLNHGDGEPKDSMGEANIPPDVIVRTNTVMDELDYVISIGAAIGAPEVAALKERKVPIVGYKCGNGGVISMEAMCASPPRQDAERYFDTKSFDAIWMTPQHIHTYKGWCETIYRCPVIVVPQIWSPYFILQRPADIVEKFPYQPGERQWAITVMDPNITVMKTSHMPILVCEEAWRRAPESFRAFFITNGLPHADKEQFVGFVNAMSAAKAGKLTLEPRFVSADMLANHSDAVVTHHWENGLNYLYYEVLYGGYPFIHNSQFLKDYGYYYESFDPQGGAEALIHAYRTHDANLGAYREKVAGLIESVDPANPANIKLHEDLLFQLKPFSQ